MYSNVTSYVYKLIFELFKYKGLTEEKIMDWPSSSPDQNSIKSQRSIVKMDVYDVGKQYNSTGGAHGVMVIVLWSRHSDTSSNPWRDWLHFTLH